MNVIPTRRQIAQFVGNDQATIRALEAFFEAVQITLPASDDGLAVETGTAVALANEAVAAVLAARKTALLAALAPSFAPINGGLSIDPAIAPVEAGLSADPLAVSSTGITLTDVAPATGALIGD